MDTVLQPGSLFAFMAYLLLQMLNKPHYAALGSNEAYIEEEEEDVLSGLMGSLMGPLHDVDVQFSMGLNNFRLCTMFTMFKEEVIFWSHEEVEHLLKVLRTEGLDGEIINEDLGPIDAPTANADDIHRVLGSEVRRELGVYLSMQRQQVP